jgi:N-terminal domain of anti-restriction factor ArdC
MNADSGCLSRKLRISVRNASSSRSRSGVSSLRLVVVGPRCTEFIPQSVFISLRPLPDGRRSAAAQAGVSDCAVRAKPTQRRFGTNRAFHSRPATLRAPFVPFTLSDFFCPAAAPVKNKTNRNRQKEKTMNLEEIKNKTREAADYLVQSLEAGHSDVLTQYLGAMAKFHNYSFGNIMLIARQKPSASNVAGVLTWNSRGRFVRRGEKGILILAPMVGRKRQCTEETTGENREAEKPQAQLYGFRAAYIFDISQTEGEELPTLTEVQGDVSGYRRKE